MKVGVSSILSIQSVSEERGILDNCFFKKGTVETYQWNFDSDYSSGLGFWVSFLSSSGSESSSLFNQLANSLNDLSGFVYWVNLFVSKLWWILNTCSSGLTSFDFEGGTESSTDMSKGLREPYSPW